GIVAGDDFVSRDVDADIGVEVEADTFGDQLLHAALDVMLLELEIRNAIAEQTAGMGFTLIEMDIVAGAGELLGGSKACGAGTDDGNALAGEALGRLRTNPALGPGAVGNRLLDGLDGDWGIIKVQGAGLLARG